MQNHLFPRRLAGIKNFDQEIRVYFALETPRTAIIFIHGYSGDATATWASFPELIPSRQKFADADIYFYGYDGLWSELNASASIFRGFLNQLLENTSSIVNHHGNLDPLFQRSSTFNYERVILVCHSLGAVIARRALLDAIRQNKDWVSLARLVLYAPAHKGAVVPRLIQEFGSCFSFLSAFNIASRYRSPLIDQLTAGSPDLLKLENDVKEAIQEGRYPNLAADQVVIAHLERIVRNETFVSDPPGETIPGSTHKTVCKPTLKRNPDSSGPLEYLEDIL